MKGRRMTRLLASALRLDAGSPPQRPIGSGGAARVRVFAAYEALLRAGGALSTTWLIGFVEGHAETDSPRASAREIREANELSLANLTEQFMRDSRCPLPKRVPQSSTF